MKILISALCALSCLMTVSAGIKIPKHVYSVAQLDEATAEAEAKNKALAFVYTDGWST